MTEKWTKLFDGEGLNYIADELLKRPDSNDITGLSRWLNQVKVEGNILLVDAKKWREYVIAKGVEQ